MAPVIAALLAACLSAINITLAIRAYLRDRRAVVHPLEPAVRDVAAAIRERGPDLHLRIDERTP